MSFVRLFGRAGAGALVAVLGLFLLVGPLGVPAQAATSVPAADATFALLLNAQRTGQRLPALTLDSGLSSIARAWSMKMADAGRQTHNPNLSTQVTGWSKYSENIASGNVVTQIFDSLIASPVHRANILDPDFTRFGVGTATDAAGVFWTTQVFMRPLGAGSTPAPTTPAVPTTKAATSTPTAAVPKATTAPVTTAPATTTTAAGSAPAAGPPGSGASSTPTGETGAGGADPSGDALALGGANAASSRGEGAPVPLLAGAGVLVLLVLGGAAFLLCRRVAT